ncbi:cytochrome c biogenesis protein CcdA/thiol-disulfide isomerase/thioredoxin [Methanohalophilus levihalophilus]|uniref:cytochrome c biogenesis CcdA family protein n=1 Tax=Methanohalophilus levihalophilus TaxID=1431282 RepID=UPI001AE94970|nr:cytochrome c biogenesis CcdA family protein [Methanohalophilus levihalophilus]MBP2029651.1 cytochrome c biogenesis protein CcdA/thiol-disulfide isomerase/thioredoxin [Methanohalophilus levihalophilus]
MTKRHVLRQYATDSIIFFLVFLLAISGISPAMAAPSDEILVEYFYEDGCLKCEQTSPVIDSVINKYDNSNYTTHNIATSYSLLKSYGIYTVPAIVVNKTTVISYSDYEGDPAVLENLLIDAIENAPAIPDDETIEHLAEENEEEGTPFELSPAVVLIAGFLAGFNPCLLAVMAFLASVTISSNGGKKEMLIVVGSFCAGIFTTYMIAGLSFLKAVSILPESRGAITLFMTVIIGILGIWHVYDAYYLRKHSESTFKTPGSVISFMNNIHGKNALALSFLAGGLFSLVKAPCVGAVYLSILDMLISRTDLLEGAFYLVIYNFGVVFPVLGLGIFLAFGLSPETVMEFREKRRSAIRFVTGVVLILLAVLLYFNVI